MDTTTNRIVIFETAIGRCAIRWSEAGISAVLLPGSRAIGDRPIEDDPVLPTFVARAISGIVGLLSGRPDDLRDVPLDDRGLDAFRRSVYAATREIPPGTTRTYGAIARAIGRPAGARDVGTALSRNPFSIIVPCHRVVAASGALTGFSAPGGLATKRRLLELEGAPGYGQQVLFG
jgi:methylated-DNA-[protein]-cysteine S-methyltransferase